MRKKSGRRQAAKVKKALLRSPNLTTARAGSIVESIRDAPSGITWEQVCDLVEQRTGARYSRQALSNNHEIRIAYAAKRQSRSDGDDGDNKANTLEAPHEADIRQLRSKIAELEMIRDHLLEKFARWIFNAGEAGLDEAFLDRALPEITRAKNH